MFCDAEKAFARVQWDFIQTVLIRMKFGLNFLKLIRLIYKKQEMVISLDGVNSNPFDIQRGVQQGCPLSPLIFDLVIEIFATLVCQQKEIQGIMRAHSSYKILLYADDNVFALRDLVNSLLRFSEVTVTFGEVSGYKINHSKSALISLKLQKEQKTQRSDRHSFLRPSNFVNIEY